MRVIAGQDSLKYEYKSAADAREARSLDKGQGSCPDYGVEKEKGRARTRFLPRRGARYVVWLLSAGRAGTGTLYCGGRLFSRCGLRLAR